jgi:hypothetical protein
MICNVAVMSVGSIASMWSGYVVMDAFSKASSGGYDRSCRLSDMRKSEAARGKWPKILSGSEFWEPGTVISDLPACAFGDSGVPGLGSLSPVSTTGTFPPPFPAHLPDKTT